MCKKKRKPENVIGNKKCDSHNKKAVSKQINKTFIF